MLSLVKTKAKTLTHNQGYAKLKLERSIFLSLIKRFIMEEYLLDRETLEKLVDDSMKKHPIPVGSAEELKQYKEEQIKALDDHITHAIFGSLNESSPITQVS